MDVKIVCNQNKYNLYKDKLEKSGFSISDNAKLLLIDLEDNIENIIVKKNGELYPIPIKEIYYIESFGREIVIHLKNNSFTSSNKLYQFELTLSRDKFVRINKSQIINVSKIKKIKPLINYRMKVTLANDIITYVSRNYYQAFKYIIGI